MKKIVRTTFILILLTGMMVSYHENQQTIQVKAASNTVTSKKAFIKALYNNMVKRKTSFQISYDGEWTDIYKDDIEGLLEEVYAINDAATSDDFDYLRGCVTGVSLSVSGNQYGSEFDISIEYSESKKQLDKVNKYVEKVLGQLDLSGKSRYKKVKLIHDYIVNHITYDLSEENYSAYAGLLKKTTVCQGYALLMYKMLTEAGVPCRYVTGNNHAWNLVKLGNKWYHIDATWDDPVSDKPVLRYTYFLTGSKSMDKSHSLDEIYSTEKFANKYPISKADYQA
ncbi:transglutaminase domain-containing protein [Anaeromicropila populeti]|uniref:Transglutaminase-like superfamily protein n=1 Tax=Anaeromicropila populeti TaxID=37658 RepID=A0A1I6J348_9FIRM|nr:transglutaminase domain-containing protein [Anaeromicropila populeti]SFR72920.1 Transglutaminase-like superfamily protein [Anaeromicropila populeti]